MSRLPEANPIQELARMLTYARPHASATEAAFVQTFIDPLGVDYDKYGNAYLRIGNAPILYSCHTDTVHRAEGRQQVKFNKKHLWLASGGTGDCLGADDGAGVWIMSEMIRTGIPGLYVFHAGEECGGLGSSFIAKERADFLIGIKAAIAFDRKGTQDVITHQGGRTCSDAFAKSLCAALGMGYRPDDTGTFTDTAHYTDLIGECSNVSVGYENAHSEFENLDAVHLLKLRDVMCKFDWTALTFERKPGEDDPEWEDMAFNLRSYSTDKIASKYKTREYDEALVDMVYQHPEVAAQLIELLGGNVDDMLQALADAGYNIEDL